MKPNSTLVPGAHRDKVLAHAKALFKSKREPAPEDVALSLRRFLKIEDRRLRMAHDGGAPGRQTAAIRSFVVDLVVQQAFQFSLAQLRSSADADNIHHGCAIVAMGGYGRGELAPYSDIDLLFLYSGSRLSLMKSLSATLLILLWDAGLTVGHSFRTVGDTTATALSDPHLHTSLIHTRYLAGSKALHNSLNLGLEKDRRRQARHFVAAVNREREARYAKFGSAVCLQEPNIKESAGGLRDYHTAMWLVHARYGLRSLDELRARNLVSEDAARKALRAYDFLWRVRHAAHFTTCRKTERLSLDLQPGLAKQFGYEAGPYSLGSEKFMRDYYRQARELHLFSETLLARVIEDEPRLLRGWRRRPFSQPAEPFSIRNGNLQFDGAADHFEKRPEAIFSALALAQAARVSFGPALRETLSHSMRQVGPTFRSSRETAQAFFKLLRRRGRVGYVLRLMHEIGFLARIIPEFARISLLVQHDLYHHFTVDEHTLRAIEALDELHVSGDKQKAALRTVFEKLADPTLLYVSLLLHDIGKGKGRGHITRGAQLAERICQRLHLSEDDTSKVVALVRLHVAMAHIAQRRDLNEPSLILRFAEDVGSLDTLNMLLLLTYADLNAVGPGVWTEWKANLLWDLYRRTRKVLTGLDEPDDTSGVNQFKDLVGEILNPSLPLSEVERHLALLPDRYQRINAPAAVATHLLMIERMKAEGFVLGWARAGNSTTELTVCVPDRHGLFADLAGTLAANGVEIMSAELNTREDGIAIDTFSLRQASTCQAVEEYRYQTIERTLARILTGELDVASLIERWRTKHAPRRHAPIIPARRKGLPRVVCDNEASPAATLIEVHAIDEPGLAYKIASEVAALGLEIVCARIATERSDAFDVFYLTDADGMKLPEEIHSTIERAICARLSNSSREGNPDSKPERGANEENRSHYQATFA